MEAVIDNDAVKVQQILKNDPTVNINFRDAKGRTPLIAASNNDHGLAVHTLLLQAGANVNFEDNSGQTALLTSLYTNWWHCESDIAESLLSKNIDINHQNKNGDTALIIATQVCSDTNLFKKIITLGAKINTQNNSGRTALMNSFWGATDIFGLLLALGADPNLKTNKGETVLHLACNDADLSEQVYDQKINLLLEAKVDVNAVTNTGMTPLMAFAYNRQYAQTQKLISHGAKVNAADVDGETVLTYAAFGPRDDVTILKLLVDAGANINQLNKNGETVLVKLLTTEDPWNQIKRDGEEVEFLINSGATLNVTLKKDKEPLLIYAIRNRLRNTTAAMINKGADLNVWTNFGVQSALGQAVSNGDGGAFVDLFISHHANLEIQDAFGTPLIRACSSMGGAAIVKKLLEAGANVHAVDSGGYSSLDIATRYGYFDIVALLRKWGG